MIVAKTLRDPKILIERLQAIAGLEPNQQVSLLSVAHIFLHSNLVLDRNTGITDDQIKMICESIFSLIEVENFNVHQFAILVVEKLMNKYEEFGKYFPIKNASQTSAEDNLAPHIEARYILPEVYCANSSWDYTKHNYKAFSYAFFISNTAVYYFNEDKLKVSCQLRKAIKSAQQVADKVEELKLTNKMPINQHEPVTRTKSANITPVQQAPAPQYRSAKSNGELIVVSACNDDVNSLNDLIRSCESFGVQTLVLSGTRNLSSETEGELPILKVKPELLDDYLSVKKMEKFHIVGIENIERSYTLKHFDSAQKTILVLGHDRHGTPENLRNLLDCTIQLPLEDVQRLQQLPIFMYSKQFLKTI
ncbi:uncharacterized protein LOC111518788 [Drosophila willistoni]|uniref:uncharacterized protein LOC111518788 n=1 Tax=Drosophila willistoni TaxID=7260 RepID=UPI001F082397|nr:uncharacterized protein LOC111518788 [Drosophila willistoni]